FRSWLPVGRRLRAGRASTHAIDGLTDFADCPALWNGPQRRFLELRGIQRCSSSVHAFRFPAFSLRAHRVEVDEPTLEQSLGDGFKGGVGLAQKVNAVIEAPKHLSN